MIARFSMRHAVAVLIALAAIGTARPAAAQAPPLPTLAHQPSPASMLLAKQIIDLKGVKNVFEPLVRGVVIKTKQMFMQTNFMWQKDLDEVAVIVEKQFEPREAEVLDASARIYASHFTEQELKDLLAFYQTPLGQKAIAEEPKALDQSMSYAGTWADSLSVQVIDSMRAEMKKRGHDI